MRRTIAAAAVTAGLLAVAGCSADDDSEGGGSEDGGGNVQAVCDDLQETVAPLDPDFSQALNEAGMAAANEDEDAFEEAKETLDELVAEIAGTLRDGAERTDDQEFSDALLGLAEAVEALGEIALGADPPDGEAFQEAGSRVEEFCGPTATQGEEQDQGQSLGSHVW